MFEERGIPEPVAEVPLDGAQVVDDGTGAELVSSLEVSSPTEDDFEA